MIDHLSDDDCRRAVEILNSETRAKACELLGIAYGSKALFIANLRARGFAIQPRTGNGKRWENHVKSRA